MQTKAFFTVSDDSQTTRTIQIVSTDRKAAESLVYGAILAAMPAIRNEHKYRQGQRRPGTMVSRFEYASRGNGGDDATGGYNKREFIDLTARILLIPTEGDKQPGESVPDEDVFPINTELILKNSKNRASKPEIVAFEWIDAADRGFAGAFLRDFGQMKDVIFLLEASRLEERGADAASIPSQLTDTIEVIAAMSGAERVLSQNRNWYLWS